MSAKTDKDEELQELLKDLIVLDGTIQHMESQGNPATYHMPDLKFPRGMKQGIPTGNTPRERFAGKLMDLDGYIREPMEYEETEEQYALRQNQALKSMIESTMFLVKDGQRTPVLMTPPMVVFVSDLFFRRISRAILWKPRGGGGSLSASILIWLCSIYHKMSFADLAGSGIQARIVYDYVKGFWACVPGLREGLLEKDPLITETRLKTGVIVQCLTSTEKQARGKHLPGLIIDESCQKDEGSERAMQAAMQGPLSEPSSMIVLLSTFHIPTGLFQEYWDFAVEKGFKRYKWDVYDAMAPCTAGLEDATEEDPKALSFCHTQCPLTRMRPSRSQDGTLSEKRIGCCGKARDAKGWMARDSVLEAMRMNLGTNIFETEFENNRPMWEKMVLDPELLDLAISDEIEYTETSRKAVGIDWGHETEGGTALALSVREPDYVGTLETTFITAPLVGDVVNILNAWREEYGHFSIFADSSNPFENAQLEEAGFDVQAVQFAVWKRWGITNMVKYLMFRRWKIISELRSLTEQLKNWRRGKGGQIVKKDDHGCDATMCSMMGFDFDKEFGAQLGLVRSVVSGNKKNVAAVGRAREAMKSQASADGSVIVF